MPNFNFIRNMKHLPLVSVFLTLVAGLPASGPHYTYDPSGRLQQVSYPQGSGILYTYDEADNLTGVETISLPPAPPSLSVISDQPNTAQLQWGSAGFTNGYAIYRRSADNRVWEELTTVTSGTTSFVDTSLVPGSDYVYQIFAVGPGGRLSAGSPLASPTRGSGTRIETLANVVPGLPNQLRVTIFSREGVAYRLESVGSLATGNWSPEPFAIVPSGSVSPAAVNGTGGDITIYIPYDFSGPNRFFRIVRAE
jgi:YD repeat-containing protein